MPARRLLAPLALAFVSLLGISGSAAAQGVGLPVGTELPDFVSTDLDGDEIHIRDVIVEGRPAIIEIWATWCAICTALQPTMEEIRQAHGDEVSMVAIAVSVNQTREEVVEHVERFGHDWPFLYDEDGAAVRALNVFGTGIVILVDRDGLIAWSSVGTPHRLVQELEKLLRAR
jgi:thiol-disulfide isomerase/thioredoxin